MNKREQHRLLKLVISCKVIEINIHGNLIAMHSKTGQFKDMYQAPIFMQRLLHVYANKHFLQPLKDHATHIVG